MAGWRRFAELVARIAYVNPQDASPEVREALDALPALNIFRMLAHADSAFVPYLGFGAALLASLELDPKLRELAILLVAERTGAEYEWVQHVGISRTIGIEEQQISAVAHGDLRASCLDADARVVLSFVAEVLETPRASDASFAALSESLPARQIVELLLVVGAYQMLARVMTALDIDIDPAVAGDVLDEARHRLQE